MATPPADAGPDIVALLLDGDDPSVRYFTLTLFGEPAEGVAAAKAQHRIMTDGAVHRLGGTVRGGSLVRT